MLGKNTYIWNIETIFGGDTEKIAAELKQAGFESVILHSAGYNVLGYILDTLDCPG